MKAVPKSHLATSRKELSRKLSDFASLKKKMAPLDWIDFLGKGKAKEGPLDFVIPLLSLSNGGDPSYFCPRPLSSRQWRNPAQTAAAAKGCGQRRRNAGNRKNKAKLSKEKYSNLDFSDECGSSLSQLVLSYP